MTIVRRKESLYLIGAILVGGLVITSLLFALQKPFVIDVDGKKITGSIYFTSTVEEVLNRNHVIIGEKDQVNPSLGVNVQKNMVITITRAFKVKVLADGMVHEILTTPVKIDDAIALAGVTLSEDDIVKTVTGALTVPDQEIVVIRVTESVFQEEEKIPFGTEYVDDDTLEKGLSKTVQPGIDGASLVTIRVTYHDGQEVKREKIEDKVIKNPTNRLVAWGNITSVSRGGENLNFREAKYMQASAYTYTGNRTATGLNPAVGMVAVDPNIIPMGSKLYIEGYGYAVAADTGGAIKGSKIDLFMEDRNQCLKWGRRTVKVYILN